MDRLGGSTNGEINDWAGRSATAKDRSQPGSAEGELATPRASR
jgi:hypothetical protein